LVFEFIVATIIFIGVVLYVIFLVNTTMSSYMSDYSKNNLNAEAQRTAEMLVHSRGVWEPAAGHPGLYAPRQFGIAQDWPVLDDTEIVYMNESCKEPNIAVTIPSLLGLEHKTGSQGVWVIISNFSQIVAQCKTGTPVLDNAFAERIAYSRNSGMVRVGVLVW
jgi:hypothetical protein